MSVRELEVSKNCVGQFRRFLLQATNITNPKKTILLWYETYYKARLVLKTATDTLQRCISCSVDFNTQLIMHSVAMLVEPQSKLGFGKLVAANY